MNATNTHYFNIGILVTLWYKKVIRKSKSYFSCVRVCSGKGSVRVTMYKVQLIKTKFWDFTTFKRFFPGISFLLSRSKVSL